MEWGGDATSVLCFILWFFQIVRSAKLYYQLGAEKKASVLGIHFVLIVANGFYLAYELIQTNQNPTWLLMVLKFLINLSIIASHQQINGVHSGDK